MTEPAEKQLFYPKKLMVPKSHFATAAAAFAGYLLGGLLLMKNTPVQAFFLLSFALTANIFDAYTFPFLNGLFGKSESLLFGAANVAEEAETPETVLFLSPPSGDAVRKKMRTMYRLGFLGGLTLFLASIVSLLKVPLHPLFVAAGAVLSGAGFFSHGLYRNEKGADIIMLEKLSSVAEALLRDEGFRSWIILLPGQRSQAAAFLARYRKYLITRPCFFLSFDESLVEGECFVDRSLAILTGYRTHRRLTGGLRKIAAENGLQVRSRKRGLDINCLCALARGYRAASVTFSGKIAGPLLLDSLKKIYGLQYMR